MANTATSGSGGGSGSRSLLGLVERSRASARLLALALRLAWRASRPLLLGIGLLALIEAGLPLVQLALTREVLDGLLELAGVRPPGAGAAASAGPPLVAWIALAALALGAGRVLQPLSAALEALAGDRLTGQVT